ncbi:MAG TPA: MGMT family protein [Candidatus Eisenbergiella merdipullorum]|uniref:MGMT family protein n=1 Tax=Candidatus Eisenbergiella merdipullorum TaxID=2838553 RepID=A0A9D2I6X4_9FIRM|nr:MGMT family protein [Candidatus Eisenbergiella merdipullorum]
MDFYRRLALAGEMIPYGKVVTYGQLALLCGCPRNSRQVGYALNHGLADDVCRKGFAFPAYRVVNSRGILSGASAFETADMQRLLLEAEGVVVKDNRVDLKVYGWKNTMEDAVFLRKSFEEKGI